MTRAGRVCSRRDGFALAAALLAVVLIGALVAALVFGANEETKISAATGSRRRTLLAAESALERELATVSVASLEAMPTGSASSRATSSFSIPVQLYVTRLDSSRFWLVTVAIEGTRTSGAASRVGLIARIVRDSAGSRTMVRIPERWWAELF
ncbi:MAG TPA: hypothetical protein VHE82_10260 [Gemmatimonadaceae bacterium]|nr:hypothetical protein [Gemmatimonadaceae bacterium]